MMSTREYLRLLISALDAELGELINAVTLFGLGFNYARRAPCCPE